MKSMNDLSKMTISQVKAYVTDLEEPTEELIQSLHADGRKGVIRLAQRLERQRKERQVLRERFLYMSEYEESYWQHGFEYIAGVDEVGRGSLAGPVVAAAVILDQKFYLLGLNDSKKLSEKQRESFYDFIQKKAKAVGIGIVDHREIDRINILQASFKAMTLALAELVHQQMEPDFIFVDGDQPIPGLVTFQRPLVGGDSSSISIAAASVIAKVTRDRMMVEYAQQYPGYGFERNKGYGSQEHQDGLAKLGPCPIHRLSYGPVKKQVAGMKSE